MRKTSIDERLNHKHYKALKDLSGAVSEFLISLDREMKLPSNPERGRRIAQLSNHLDMANDLARYGFLGVDFRNDKKPK